METLETIYKKVIRSKPKQERIASLEREIRTRNENINDFLKRTEGEPKQDKWGNPTWVTAGYELRISLVQFMVAELDKARKEDSVHG